jgi:betaine-aldehyde dehydrogenase
MATEYKMWLNGEWRAAESGEVLQSINPATSEVLATFPKGGVADTQKAVRSAREAFDNGEWSKLTHKERGEILRRIAQLIREKASELAMLETMDNGKPIKETTFIDVPMTADTFEYFAGLSGEIRGETIPIPASAFSYTVREPVGVVAEIIPFNYPLLIAAWKLAPALAVGNTVILKPSELTSLTALELGKLMEKSGLPKGVVNIITGLGSEVGAELASNPHVDMLSFTGGTETGKQIMRMASNNVKKTLMELGGKGANIVFNDADLEVAVDGTLATIFMNQGQMCTAGSRLLLQEDIHDKFVEMLVSKTNKLKVGNGLDPDTHIGPLISAEHRGRVLQYIELGIAEGAKLVSGGKMPQGGGLENGFFIQPTIFDGVTTDMKIAQDEIFGPFLSILTFSTQKEASRLANATRYGLAASIWSKDIQKATVTAQQIKAGTVWINTYGGFYNEAPFGGYKESGIGRELGKEGLLEYTQLKCITVDLSPGGKSLSASWYSL